MSPICLDAEAGGTAGEQSRNENVTGLGVSYEVRCSEYIASTGRVYLLHGERRDIMPAAANVDRGACVSRGDYENRDHVLPPLYPFPVAEVIIGEHRGVNVG